MYTGQVDIISNTQDWVSDFFQLTDDDTGDVINILNPDVAFDCSVYISNEKNHYYCLASTSISDGGIVVSESDVPDEPGFQWTFAAATLNCLCAGTYSCGVKVTMNGLMTDVILGSITVVEGNR